MRTTRSTPAALVAIGSLACIGGALIALAGCPNTASTSIYTPPTGIQIDSQSLVMGIGCGPGPGQVYRYAAVVTQVTETGTPYVTSGVFDCFSDALFANLPSPDGGATEYSIGIYAFDQAAFPSELGGCEDLPLTSPSPCPGDDASVVRRYESQATWTTTCTATQSPGVPQPAVCGELLPNEAGAGGDGGDAGETADATSDTSSEASDAPADVPAEAADAPTAEASDGPVVSGEGGDAPLE